jgi:hypothetical protein
MVSKKETKLMDSTKPRFGMLQQFSTSETRQMLKEELGQWSWSASDFIVQTGQRLMKKARSLMDGQPDSMNGFHYGPQK